MTKLLYLQSPEAAYETTFEGRIVAVEGQTLVLDQTLFYPEGGGQPSDVGMLRWDGGAAPVVSVTKRGGVSHTIDAQELEGALPTPQALASGGVPMQGTIDWQRRYALMRMHTSQHLVSGVAFDLLGARTVGNQLYPDRSRIDLAPARWDDVEVDRLLRTVNGAIAQGGAVTIGSVDRAQLEASADAARSNLELLPQSVRSLRMVRLGGWDVCPCAGTHVRDLSELRPVALRGTTNKGKGRLRLEYAFRPAA